MNQIQQARQGLLIYLQANRTYIQQKIYNQFNIQCIENKLLNTLDISKMIKNIKDIFDFSNNQIYSYFFIQLENNIKKYIKQQYSRKAIPSYYVLDIEKLTDIIKYCIIHGFDQNSIKKLQQTNKQTNKQVIKQTNKQVIKQQSPKPPPKPRVIFIPQQKKIQPPKDEFAHIKSKVSTFLQRDKIPQKKQFKIQKFSMPQINVLPRYLINIPKIISIKQDEQDNKINVSPLNQDYIRQHKKIMRQRLQKLFNFYCFQQQSLGQRPTFDRIKGQGELMNLGKFMQFCQSTKLFNCKQITKDILMIEYKKISQGKIEITFDIFQKIIQKLDQKYLFNMGHDIKNNPIPTYEARLMLNQPNKLGQLKKHRHLIFGTRIKQGRQIKQFIQNNRYQKKQLTLHSGRFSNDLTIDIKDKPQNRSSKSMQKSKSNRIQQTTVHLNQLKKLKLPKISWIVQQQDDLIDIYKK